MQKCDKRNRERGKGLRSLAETTIFGHVVSVCVHSALHVISFMPRRAALQGNCRPRRWPTALRQSFAHVYSGPRVNVFRY